MDYPAPIMRPTRRIIACLLLACLAAACAQHQSVRHLERHPWAVNQPDSLSLKFWRFTYAVKPANGGFSVEGLAYPLMDGLPVWATYASELWLAAYVCDAQGHVVTDDVRVIASQPIAAGQGIPFQFSLTPRALSAGKLSITFGYRMTLTDAPAAAAATPEPGAPPRVFFASESALTRL